MTQIQLWSHNPLDMYNSVYLKYPMKSSLSAFVTEQTNILGSKKIGLC